MMNYVKKFQNSLYSANLGAKGQILISFTKKSLDSVKNCEVDLGELTTHTTYPVPLDATNVNAFFFSKKMPTISLN